MSLSKVNKISINLLKLKKFCGYSNYAQVKLKKVVKLIKNKVRFYFTVLPRIVLYSTVNPNKVNVSQYYLKPGQVK